MGVGMKAHTYKDISLYYKGESLNLATKQLRNRLSNAMLAYRENQHDM